jgi:hypothetical protein
MPVRVCRCAIVGVPSPLDPLTVTRRPMLLRSGPEEGAGMPTPVYLESRARAVGRRQPSLCVWLGPDCGRKDLRCGPVRPFEEASRPHRGHHWSAAAAAWRSPTPRTTSGSRAASAAGVAVAACLASSSRLSLGLGAAILREFVRTPSGPPLRVASERSLCLAREVGCILLGGPPVTTAAAGPVDRRLFGLVGRGLGLGSATSGQRGSSLGRGCYGPHPLAS